MDERERKGPDDGQDDVKLPDEHVEDLEPDAEGAEDVKGGSTYQWWQKVEEKGPDG